MNLIFPDGASLADLGSYAARAKVLDDDGAMRLQASGTTLAAYVGVLGGRGLLGEGTVLGLRVVALAEAAEVDVTVPLAAVTDRTARPNQHAGPVQFALPPVTVHPQWAALAPPRSGWEPVAEVTSDLVNIIARQGISDVTVGSPEGSRAAAVASLRHRIWTTMSDTDPALPAGLALAAYGLGFVVDGEPLRLFAHGRWARLSSSVGHALIR
ncbi:MAG: hypothetical protein ABI131_09735 [Nostocoides sp.]